MLVRLQSVVPQGTDVKTEMTTQVNVLLNGRPAILSMPETRMRKIIGLIRAAQQEQSRIAELIQSQRRAVARFKLLKLLYGAKR